ncbi:cell division protein FtsL [Neorhizobium sp. DT-125]|uniref:cell division protein FtsL n=1 Tax=Neorhizobium sp. DT-125 TaxID=3396163 RepID=UPI003F19566D
MLRSFDLVLIGIMTAAAVVTYTIKHRADEKLAEVRRLESEIKLEKDTIELLKADWALLTQPNRLHRLINVYNSELGLAPTEPTQLAMPKELPMMRSALPQPETTIEDIIAGKDSEVAAALKGVAAAKAKPATKIPVPLPRGSIEVISTGSVNR